MYKLVIFIGVFFSTITGIAQVHFESLSFDNALQQARVKGKLVFLQYESADCEQCNEVADKAFEDVSLGKQLSPLFIAIRIDPDHPDREKIAILYNKNEAGFGTLFLRGDGALLQSFTGSSSRAQQYVDYANKAFTQAGEGLTVNVFEKEYRQGNKSLPVLEQLLVFRKAVSLATDSLLDEYVQLLPPDSLQSITCLAFIAEQAPLIGSVADYLLRKDRMLFNKAWFTLNLSVRISINRRIIYRSMQKAIQQKNTALATRIAYFAKGTYDANSTSGRKVYDYNLMEYAQGTSDTIRYLSLAIPYYDTYYMAVATDSIRKKDSLNLQQLVAAQKPESIKQGDSVIYKKTVRYSPLAQTLSRDLINGARNVANIDNSHFFLKKALTWAAKANEFYSTPESMDLYAKLLYQQGERDQAIAWETKAIQLKAKRGYKTVTLEKTLEEIKKGTLPPGLF